MKCATTRELLSAAKLNRDREFAKALAYLEAVDSARLPVEEKWFCDLLRCEARLGLGDYDVGNILQGAIQYYKKSSNNELFAKAKFLYGWYLVSVGRHFEAHEVLLESYLNYKRCDNLDAVQRVLNYLALVQFQTGAVEDALKNLQRCIDINVELGNPDNVATLQRNMAVVQLRIGTFYDALQQLKRIEGDVAGQSENNQYHYYLVRGMLAALLGDVALAHELIARTVELSSEFKREKAHYFEYVGWIHILDGKFRDAEKALKGGIELSLKIAPESALVSQSKRLLADAYLGQEKHDLAEKAAREALKVAGKINERAEIAACYRVFARVEQSRGDKVKACDWFAKAMSIFSAINSRYELALTRYLAAMSGLYDNGERLALLCMAREYFKSENVARYPRRVDRELAVLRIPTSRIESSDKDRPVFIAADRGMKSLVKLAENIARSDLTVFLTGPTGSGKDQLARYIHYYSGREGKFVTVNCAAIPDSMVEAELFGYRKGAFTGAEHSRAGLFEEADGGTFYLNELADSSREFQAKLLEVIETKAIRPLGVNVTKRIDIRIIASTNHDLKQRLRDGRFRPDLYHRLHEIPINLPPLSERYDDIVHLVRHFLAQCGYDFDAKPDRTVFDRLCHLLADRGWPGNVRELKAEVCRLYLLGDGSIGGMVECLTSDKMTEREALIRVLEETEWNRSAAARHLGVSEGTIRNRIRKYGLKPGRRS
ncbi:MAG: sigma 54-interacting transcriptional regulator [Candidatus Zixiibacteriota bacterium]|nr:MAG: sigma 54-interacting transcriptional regulator [candidate division Zixibacteria bacterium]